MNTQEKILLTNKKITPEQLLELCHEFFGDMVKLVIDIERKWVAIGGELHADAEGLLIKNGSHSKDIWGCNFYPWHAPDDRIEYTALINIRPRQGNLSMEIQDVNIRTEVRKIVEALVLKTDEKLV
jgi:hypothetical protein